jgi:hypothetical protein
MTEGMRLYLFAAILIASCSHEGMAACRDRVARDGDAIGMFPNATMVTESGAESLPPSKSIVYIIGGVRCPGGFLVEKGKGPTAKQALSWAGGPLSTADLNESILIRQTSDGPKSIPVDLDNSTRKNERLQTGG